MRSRPEARGGVAHAAATMPSGTMKPTPPAANAGLGKREVRAQGLKNAVAAADKSTTPKSKNTLAAVRARELKNAVAAADESTTPERKNTLAAARADTLAAARVLYSPGAALAEIKRARRAKKDAHKQEVARKALVARFAREKADALGEIAELRAELEKSNKAAEAADAESAATIAESAATIAESAATIAELQAKLEKSTKAAEEADAERAATIAKLQAELKESRAAIEKAKADAQTLVQESKGDEGSVNGVHAEEKVDSSGDSKEQVLATPGRSAEPWATPGRSAEPSPEVKAAAREGASKVAAALRGVTNVASAARAMATSGRAVNAPSLVHMVGRLKIQMLLNGKPVLDMELAKPRGLYNAAVRYFALSEDGLVDFDCRKPPGGMMGSALAELVLVPKAGQAPFMPGEGDILGMCINDGESDVLHEPSCINVKEVLRSAASLRTKRNGGQKRFALWSDLRHSSTWGVDADTGDWCLQRARVRLMHMRIFPELMDGVISQLAL